MSSLGAMVRRCGRAVIAFGAWLLAALTLLACTLRLRCIWLRFWRGLAEVGLRLRPSLYDSQDEFKQASAAGMVRNRRQRERLCRVLREAESAGTPAREAAQAAGLAPEEMVPGAWLPLDQVFADAPADIEEVAVQYSGGADSTLAALLAAQRFPRVHLLTFHHSFIRDRAASEVNARKLQDLFGPDRILHRYLDATAGITRVMFGDYWRDLRKYGTRTVADPCLACKLSFDTETIRYALAEGVKLVLDGADLRVPWQLSQGHPELLELRRRFYLEYGIEFQHPVVEFEETTAELLGFGLAHDPPCLLYPHQPRCVGNDLVATIYKRFYFLPRYGLEGLTKFAMEWAPEKIALCRQLLPTPPADRQEGRSVKPAPAADPRPRG